ncbi:MAG: 1-acyl-sn-glycerol-3-phosphate acyltransferase [Candidatus Eremiobacteraeota bacterium]|nr:1-acyl-sn-glycerol-3-phosphate acyltransferase [Candidatus Eremiobacteraeota bacterium]MBC5826472.1 1-acyl-sn-glycerol-3-phosphate acyltransferase [Candidatus Eremiobacteraeota bacterium]
MSLYTACRAALIPLTRLAFGARVRGVERVPATGALVVAANHRSYLDPPLLGTWFPRVIHFMAKRELFEIPILGRLLGRVNAFPVERDRADLKSVRRALRLLKKGEVVGIFPEGRRNSDGAARARGGAVLIAATAGCPLLPVAIVNSDEALRRLRHSAVEIRIGEPMTFQGRERKLTKGELRDWTEQVAGAISALGAK